MTEPSKILILDDEPHLLDWLGEYLKTKGYDTTFATDVPDAMRALTAGEPFRMLILDLNVPAPSNYVDILRERGPLYEHYHGLYVAEQARNQGYRGRQVIVYSVHDVDEVRLLANKIGVTYITKGRPRAFKSEIDDVLNFDPSARKA